MQCRLFQGAYIAAVVMLALCVHASAENWVEVSRKGSGAVDSVDMDFVRLADGRIRYVARQVMPRSQPVGIYDGKMSLDTLRGFTDFVEIRVLSDVDCRTGAVANGPIEFRDARGKVVSKALPDSDLPVVAPAGLSVTEKMVCTAAGQEIVPAAPAP